MKPVHTGQDARPDHAHLPPDHREGARFQLDVEAATRADALKMVTRLALDYDGRDSKETRVIAVQELQKIPVLNPSN